MLTPPVTRICLTPTRNEEWIADRFARAAALWADHIIVADQNSTDATRAALLRTNKVQIVVNSSELYDESSRQRLLLSKAREIGGKRIFIALDADEALSGNFASSQEWDQIRQAAPGTVLRFRWVNVLPGFKKAWISPELIPCGYVDDYAEHTGTKIHSRRVPWPDGAPVLDLFEIVVLHFQYVVWDRVVSKHRWYQAWEHLNHPEKGPLEIFRGYNHMNGSWEDAEIHPLRPEWSELYEQSGIDFRSLEPERVTWWDREIIEMFRKYGTDHFRKIAIWDRNWNGVAPEMGVEGLDLADPRSCSEKTCHRFLKATQGCRAHFIVRCVEKILRWRGW